MKILIIEDDSNLQNAIKNILFREGYQVTLADNGIQGIEKYQENKPDLICLDIMMPGKSGYEVLEEIRKEDKVIPILIVSAKNEEIDKVIGLDLGADDFIVKPFGMSEFVARIRAVTRRVFRNMKASSEVAPFNFGKWEVTPSELKGKDREGNVIELSLKDLEILKVFASHQGEVLSRDYLFDTCWGETYFANSRTLDQHISKLRKKIERNPKNPAWIVTVHGAGYRYTDV